MEFQSAVFHACMQCFQYLLGLLFAVAVNNGVIGITHKFQCRVGFTQPQVESVMQIQIGQYGADGPTLRCTFAFFCDLLSR